MPVGPLQKHSRRAGLLPRYSVSERSLSGLLRLQRGLHHEEEAPAGAGEQN